VFEGLKWLRLVPDTPGKGGWKTGFHTFQVQPVNDTRTVTNLHPYRGRWRKDPDTRVVPGTTRDSAATSTTPRSVHAYLYPSLTDPSAAPSMSLLGHHVVAPNTNRYWDFTANTTRDIHVGNSVPATFLDIAGRCFVADGAREGMVLDDRTPAIHAQRNQNLGIGTPTQALGITSIGGFVTRASGVAGNPNLSGVGSAYVHIQTGGGSPYINTPNPDSPIGTLVVGDVVTPFILDPNYAVYSFALMAPAALAVNAVTSNTTPFTATGTISITSGTSLVTLAGAIWPAGGQYMGLAINFNGYSYVLLETGPYAGAFDVNGAAFPLTNVEALILGIYDGPTLVNVPYTITGCQITMPAASTLTTITSGTPGYSQTTHSNLVHIGLTAMLAGVVAANLGNISFDPTLDPTGPNFTYQPGPKYAYAWYDPETGHCSNISPLTQIPAPVLTVNPSGLALNNLTPYFQIDPGTISYPSGVDATRFSHILFFRTLSARGSSTLYPIGSLMPFVGKVHPGGASTLGSWNPFYKGWLGLPTTYTAAPPDPATQPPYNLWYDFSSDSDLLLSGGFRAPQETNEKPMALLRGGVTQPGYVAYQAYWDRRLWIVNTQEPDVVAFSCDDAQCPLGIPEESFPPTNRLRIPSVDGRVLALKVVGEMLLITTERWAYTVSGNNESNYRLLRVSTRMSGVGLYQMDEFSSDVEGVPSTVYFFGQDGIVYEWVPGGAVNPISAPIQNLLDTAIASLSTYQASRVHCMSVGSRRLVLLDVQGIPQSGPFLFDIERRVWTNNPTDDGATFPTTFMPFAYTTIYGLTPPVQEVFSVLLHGGLGTTVRSWMQDNNSSTLTGSLATFPLNFDGKKNRKQIVMVNGHFSGGTATCFVAAGENFAGATTVNMVTYPDLLESIYASGAAPVDSATAEDLVVMTAMFDPVDGKAPVGYRFVIGVNMTSTNQQQELYAVDIGYIDYGEPGEGDA
jgi:hypothetical protein